MVIFPLAPDQTIAQMWSNGARGGDVPDISTNIFSRNTFRSFQRNRSWLVGWLSKV